MVSYGSNLPYTKSQSLFLPENFHGENGYFFNRKIEIIVLYKYFDIFN